MDIKALGNALFRDGDFKGAADAFQQAIESIRQISSPQKDTADLEVACLCNLAYAYIKLGLMGEAEEACCRALRVHPSCTKARFRRGQARLALGKPIEAAADFGEVCIQEPNNSQATKMLRRAQDEERLHPPVTVQCSDGESGIETRPSVESATHASGVAVPTVTATNILSSPARGMKVNLGHGEQQPSPSPEQSFVEDSKAPSFMVPGWLTSAERRLGRHPSKDGITAVDIHHGHQDVGVGCSSPKATKSNSAEGFASLSRNLSPITGAQKDVPKTGRESPSACSTIATAAETEWSRMQLEEACKVRESLQRWSARRGGQHPTEVKQKRVVTDEGRQMEMRREDSKGKRIKKGSKKAAIGTGGGPAENISDWWADLEEEESKLRQAFRTKLGIGESTKSEKKDWERGKAKNKAARCMHSSDSL